MRKRFFFNIKHIDLLPVFIPVILSLCSWTIYKINHKTEEKTGPTSQYISPIKINCDFLSPVYNSKKVKIGTSILKKSDIPVAFVANAAIINDKYKNTILSNRPENLFFDSKALVHSGYIGEIGDRDAKEWDSDPSDNIFTVQLSNINKTNSYILSYEVDGYSNINSITRSVNGSYAIGGYIKEKKSGWTEVSENIDPLLYYKKCTDY